MGFLDSAGELLNKGVANAGRGTKAISLKAQISDLGQTRSNLMSQLGESLYESVRFDANLRSGLESLFSAIEGIDAQLAALRRELAVVDLQMNTVSAVASGYTGRMCGNCGKPMADEDAFCMSCGERYVEKPASSGTSASQPSSALADARCPDAAPAQVCLACGAVAADDDAFCMGCGTPLPKEQEAPAEEAASQGDAVLAAESPEASLDGSDGASRQVEWAEGVDAWGRGAGLAFGQSVELEPVPNMGEQCDSEPSFDSMPKAAEDSLESGGSAPVQEVEPQVNFCSSCGYKVSGGAAFCRNCGSRLSGE